MSFTVVPLHNLSLPAGTRIPFGTRFVLQDVPEWLNDYNILDELSRPDRMEILKAKHALVSEYDAESVPHPDPEWKSITAKSIQELRFEQALMANLAIWIIQPSPVCLTVGFHALTRLIGGRIVDPPFVQAPQSEPRIYCHPNDEHNPVKPTHLKKAATLYSTLATVQRKNPVWAALRAFWAAVTSRDVDYRYPLFWQGLESLFGADNERRGVTHRLRNRISFFLASDPATQQQLSAKVNSCYDIRSQIIHGRWEAGPTINANLGDTEGIDRLPPRTRQARRGRTALARRLDGRRRGRCSAQDAKGGGGTTFIAFSQTHDPAYLHASLAYRYLARSGWVNFESHSRNSRFRDRDEVWEFINT
jgi:Apea-like HEPN